ncbi:MAG: helix-destabilizing protein [Uliginosibacterium sp.]|nr:helix-destabilizing protein [Uliginosibacterium sp.]
MFKIEILVGAATKRSGTSKGGKPYEMIEQEAWAHVCDQQGNPAPYPSRIVLTLENNQMPYPAGHYTLHESCFYVGDYQKLTLGRVRLVPIPMPEKRAGQNA